MTQRALATTLAVLLAPFFVSDLAHAQTEEAWHFQSDTSRHARVDDRGGLGEGYSFSIDYDPTDGNSEDFCPHCRLSVMVSDPGLDMAELVRVGVDPTSITSAESMVARIQSVVAADPTGLAMMVAPGLTGADLAAVVAEIQSIQAHLATVLTALTTLSQLTSASYDWSTADIDALVSALHLAMDTGFRGDFSDPNDPRVFNSGVRVYTLSELLAGLAGQGLGTSAQMQIQSALSSVPGLSGPFEISGDDDAVTDPARFHGYHTDLTIRQRTYVVDGFSAYLVVYTISNETTRVFPLVEASMMADFDIPPLSYDTATDFDPATQMVMDYDTIPYTMPEQHYWFGLAPASALPASPGHFAFANWNIDQNFTLAQQGTDTTQQNRYRFFLFDPSISGDHDMAMGKSEKQGAISQMLAGPLFPGQSAQVAFCYAAGEGGSSAAARAELTAIMSGCRALYTTLNPVCGDGVATYPEECDAPGSTTCTASCHTITCGDGRVDGEPCDDGNTMDGDGCDATCHPEVCGNGIVQAGEECDDGNLSSLDSCLNDCTTPRCGDGIVRGGMGCTAGADCGCAGYQYCFTGQFTIDTLPVGVRSAFSALNGVPIDYRIAFDAVSTDTTTLAAQGGIRVTTGPMHVEMTGAALAASIARGLEGQTWSIDVLARPARGGSPFVTSRVEGLAGRTRVGFELFSPTTTGFTVTTTRLGVPILSTVRATAGRARLSVIPAVGTPTDVATGAARWTIATAPMNDVGELCDDGNTSDFDACTSACVPAACGDGFLQPSTGEECDEGPMPPSWCVGCRRVGSSCGNGMLEATFGEECDDANVMDGDGCSALCRTERCGDGVVQASEQCDDGMNGDGDGCTDTCMAERCGDGVVQMLREACDEGASNGDTAACTSMCAVAVCGDGLVHAGVEQCDDGNTSDVDGCSSACRTETCGDGAPGPHEDCDDGNAASGDGCTPTCHFEICGDGLPGMGEQCDDGNLLDGDGCSKDCALENLARCGNGTLDHGEQCDDGGHANGDGCSEFCQLENPAACGNGTEDPGEGCDDGNLVSGDGCSSRCTVERCGDGIQARGEGCDDGNNRDGDGCNAMCELEPATCGNGVQELGEQCDGGAGCDATCHTTMPGNLGMTCGNGTLDFGEQCDDGGRFEGDGCDATCQLEASVCGNSRLERGETCDDGNTRAGDGCDTDCAIEGEAPMPIPMRGCTCGVAGARGARGVWLLAAVAAVLAARRRRGRRGEAA